LLIAHRSSPPDLKKKIAHTIDVNTLAAITTHAKKVSHGVLKGPILSFAPFDLFGSLLFGVGNEPPGQQMIERSSLARSLHSLKTQQ
jgi:hypothetical protein